MFVVNNKFPVVKFPTTVRFVQIELFWYVIKHDTVQIQIRELAISIWYVIFLKLTPEQPHQSQNQLNLSKWLSMDSLAQQHIKFPCTLSKQQQ